MHRYERLVLDSLRGKGALDLDSLMKSTGLGRDEVLWALENLDKEAMVELSRAEGTEAVVTPEGLGYAKTGLPETKLLKRLKEGTIEISKLREKEEQLGLQWAKRNNLIKISNGTVMLAEKGVADFENGLPEEKVLRELAKSPEAYDKMAKGKGEMLAGLVKRGLIEVKRRRRIESVKITSKGGSAKGDESGEGIGALTKSIITSGGWKGKQFKSYDVNVPVASANGARRHPLRHNMEDIRRSYLANGFREVSGPVVDSAFWVFDSLFQPQDHPARDAQDTFYLSGLEEMEIGSRDYVKRVKKAHTKGWHYRWNEETAREAVLRTHTTSVSAHYIYDVLSGITKDYDSQQFPMKLFSLGRIFRNENIDYRHLADFYQTDGIVIGKGLTFANLFDILLKLYDWLGAEIKFKPSYFPFVEPGVEMYAYSKMLKEWVEIGGAGLIRREITGIKRKDVSVLAWGIGVDRLMLIRPDNNVKSISELYNNGLGWVRGRKSV